MKQSNEVLNVIRESGINHNIIIKQGCDFRVRGSLPETRLLIYAPTASPLKGQSIRLETRLVLRNWVLVTFFFPSI